MTEAYGAPEIRYTDRHVREDESLMRLATAYVDVYGGDFEPLVAAKQELAMQDCLSTRTARVVLNCMRYDVNVSASLPAPQPPALILEQPRRRRQRFEPPATVQCNDPRSHYSHVWTPIKDEPYVNCPGIPYAINRMHYELPAKIKRPFVMGRGANSLVHRTTGEGYMVWHPHSHRYGFFAGPTLHVRAACTQTTRLLKSPILLKEIPTDEEWWHDQCHQGCF